jgi:hypothetical protein
MTIINVFACGDCVPNQARTRPQVFVALMQVVTAIVIMLQ